MQYTSNQPLPTAETMLPNDFIPGINHVVIGRGKKSYNHVGNVQFRAIVASKLNDYKEANTKIAKSIILANVVEQVHASGGFIKECPSTSGRWMTAGSFLAREKTSQTFRDILSDGYKSSKSSKKKRRQEQLATTAPVEIKSLKRRRCDNESAIPCWDEITNFESLFDNDEDLLQDVLEPFPCIASNNTDDDLFSRLSAVVSPLSNECNMTAFEPLPFMEEGEVGFVEPRAAIENVSEKHLEFPLKSDYDYDTWGSNYQKFLSVYNDSSADFPTFVPTRNISTARTA